MERPLRRLKLFNFGGYNNKIGTMKSIGTYRDLTSFSDQALLECAKTALPNSIPSIYDVMNAFEGRYSQNFEVLIEYNVEVKPRMKLYGPVSLLEKQGLIHPLVMNLIKAYVENQKKEDLYFFVYDFSLGGEVYTITC